jgi:isoleucyl-tRNA synthetase
MHGFINDSQGRKMSKSLGNYILPEEVTSKYGVDCTRYYMIGAANPGLDMNYNMEDTDAKFRNLLVYWNLHKYALEHCHVHDIVPRNIMRADPSTLAPEERYLQSRLHHATKRMDELFSAYALNEIPAVVEEFLLDVSRTYIQLIRDKASGGSEEEKQQVADALVTAVLEGMTLMAPIAPFFSETVYQHLRAAFPAECKEESIHLRSWPAHDDAMIDERLEADFLIAKDCIGAILAARDKAQLGVRWPVDHVRVECTPAQADALRRMEALILLQTNVKALRYDPPELTYTITPNTKTLGKAFGKETQAVMRLIEKRQRDLAAMVRENAPHAVIDDDGAQRTILPEHIAVERHVPDNYQAGNGNTLNVYLSTVRTPALEREGYAREIIRRIQQLRKNAGLVKTDRIIVELATTDAMLRATIDEHAPSIAERTGSRTLQPVATLSQGLPHVSTETIKGTSIIVGFTVV